MLVRVVTGQEPGGTFGDIYWHYSFTDEESQKLTIMDLEVADRITFCGCRSTRIEQRGRNAWIVKNDDVKAVVRGVAAEDLQINFDQAVIFIAADPLA